jgi:hypothetical protein
MARRALKVCNQPGCPEITDKPRCPDCAGAYERRRGTRQTRGYDAAYDRARAWWKPKVERGEVDCHAPACLLPTRRIHLGAEWDLGHDDQRRIRGPEHQRCNRSAGGKASHARTA